MKNFVSTTLILMLALANHAQIVVKSVDKRVLYNLQYQYDSTDVGSMRLDRFILQLGDNGSLFSSESRFFKDSAFKTDNPTAGMGIARSAFNYTLLKEGKKITTLHNYAVYKFKLTEDCDFKWEITKEEKEILGYKCQKATTFFRGRHFEAWFAPDIPIVDGPYKFSNLPGLILEVYDIQKYYRFWAESIFGMKKQDAVFDDTKYEAITNKQYKEFMEKVKEKPSLIVETPKMKLPQELMDNYDKRQRERNKKDNNPIELNDE
jgi:GLPGLI family protein